MKWIVALTSILFLGCQSPSKNPGGTVAEQKAHSSIYVQVVGPDGMEILSDMATSIREEAYKHYATMGLVPASNLADADMTVVIKANEIALKGAVKVSVDKTKMTRGQNIWVTVRGEGGVEYDNPIADVIKEQTYAEFATKGFNRAARREEADMNVSVYTNDKTLRAAVRKALEHQKK